MKIKSLSVCVALLATLFQSCKKDDPNPPDHPPVDSTQIVDLKKGLLLYLPFSGNFADSSGNNNPTNSVGATLTSDQKGSPASAFGGTGHGERIIVTNNGSIKFDSSYTVSMNVMLNSFQRSSFLNLAKHGSAEGWGFGMGTDIGNTNLVNMNTVDTTGNCGTTVQPYNSQLLRSASALQPGTWYNLVMVFSKGVSRIYIDGQLDATLTTPDKFVPECMSSDILVGGWWDGDPTSTNGKLDEIRIYDRALNAKEISKLAEGFPVQSPTPIPDLKRGLLVYLPFNGSLADSSGNNNPTQIVGSGAGLTYDMHGYASSAYGSDGTSGRLQVTNNGSISFDTAFSISLSFMERQVTDRQVITSFVNVATGYGPTFLLGNSMPGAYNVWFGTATSSQTCSDYGNANDHNKIDTTNFTPLAESWYNIVATFLNGHQKIYVNGQLISEKWNSDPHTFICPTANLVIGGWWDSDPLAINGKIDNFRLYNRALSAEEITMLAEHYQPNSNSVHTIVNH